MTVKSLCDLTKSRIIAKYQLGTYQIKTLAQRFETSERTINRVLIEAGLLTPVPRIKADAYNVMQVLKKHGIDPTDLDKVLVTGTKPYTTYENVVDYLYDMEHEEVTELFFNAMMHKALDAQLESQAVAYQVEADADADLPF